MGFPIQTDIKKLAIQLNNLLQDQGGFLAERFSEPLIARWVDENKKTQKILNIIIISLLGVVFLLMLYVIFVIGPNQSSF